MKLLDARNNQITGAGEQEVGSNHSLSVCKKMCHEWRHPPMDRQIDREQSCTLYAGYVVQAECATPRPVSS